MCFHSKQSKDAQALESRFKAKVKNNLVVQSEYYNGFTFPKTPVISNLDSNIIDNYTWGLISNWSTDKLNQQYTLNAKIETLNEKPSFKNNIKNRCLVIADGFFEWQWLDPKGKQKQKYLISLSNNELFAFAGIWDEWVDKKTGELVKSYSIITTEANELMAEIHNNKKRMPIILTEENENRWLNGDDYLFFKNPEINLIASKEINETQLNLFLML